MSDIFASAEYRQAMAAVYARRALAAAGVAGGLGPCRPPPCQNRRP